jgi:riboflavin kinase/FMN adenylyltransferase
VPPAADDEGHLALVNIGRRPTFERDGEDLIEVHLVGREGDFYGLPMEVFFAEWMREERRFAGVDALVAQLEEDRRLALARHGTAPAFARPERPC